MDACNRLTASSTAPPSATPATGQTERRGITQNRVLAIAFGLLGISA